MARRNLTRTFLTCAVASAAVLAGASTNARGQEGARPALALNSARVAIAGTSNIHAFTAATTTVKVTRAQLAGGVAGANFWEAILKPGAVEGFEIAIPAATLSSPKEGLDKNMHKALKTDKFANITFRLARLEPGAAGAVKAIGTLQIAGVEREIAVNLKTQRKEAGLAVSGTVELLMTDYGIKPPTAMLGMLKTDPKVTVTFETLLEVPLT